MQKEAEDPDKALQEELRDEEDEKKEKKQRARGRGRGRGQGRGRGRKGKKDHDDGKNDEADKVEQSPIATIDIDSQDPPKHQEDTSVQDRSEVEAVEDHEPASKTKRLRKAHSKKLRRLKAMSPSSFAKKTPPAEKAAAVETAGVSEVQDAEGETLQKKKRRKKRQCRNKATEDEKPKDSATTKPEEPPKATEEAKNEAVNAEKETEPDDDEEKENDAERAAKIAKEKALQAAKDYQVSTNLPSSVSITA